MDLDVPIDPDISALFKDKPVSIEILRSSIALTEYLSNIAQLLNSRRIVQAWGSQSINARLDSMLQLLVEGLCAPSLFDILGSLPNLEHAQKILIKAFTLFRMTEELYRESEFDPLETNYYRCHLFFEILSFKSSRLFPVTLMLQQHGDTLLQRLACHLLSVTALNQELLYQIQRVNAQLYNAVEELGGNGFMFEQCANSELSEQLLVFFDHLSQHASRFVRECRREEIIHCVPSQVRHQLKNESYLCPSDILHIYNRKYKRLLNQLSLPLQPHSLEDLLQARKDILREKIIVNKLMYPRSVIDNHNAPTMYIKNNKNYNNHNDNKKNTDKFLLEEEEKQREARVFEGWDAMRSEVKKVLVFLLGLDDDAWFADVPPAAATTPPVTSKNNEKMNNNINISNNEEYNNNNMNNINNNVNTDNKTVNNIEINDITDETINNEDNTSKNDNERDTCVVPPLILPLANKKMKHSGDTPEDTQDTEKVDKKAFDDTHHKRKRSLHNNRPKLSFFANYNKDNLSNTTAINNSNNTINNNNIHSSSSSAHNSNTNGTSAGNNSLSPVPFLLPRSVSLPLGDTLISPISSRHNSVTGCVTGVSQSHFNSPPVSRNNSITVSSCVSPVRRNVSNTSFTSSATTTSQHSFSSLHSISFPQISTNNMTNSVQLVHSVTTPRDTQGNGGKGVLLSSSHSHSGVATLNEHHTVCHSHFGVSRDTHDTPSDTVNNSNTNNNNVNNGHSLLRDYARHVFQDILGLVHALLLMATSRTFAGGDAFILLNDLYGGEGLMFCSNDTVSRHTINTSDSVSRHNTQTNNKTNNSSVCRDTSSSNSDVSRSVECVTTVAITPRGMKIAVPMLYSLFDCDTLTNSSLSREEVCPLCVFHCVTTTLLLLNVELMHELETQYQQQQQQSLSVSRHAVTTSSDTTARGGVHPNNCNNNNSSNSVSIIDQKVTDDADSTVSFSTCVTTHSRSDTLDTVSCNTTSTTTFSTNSSTLPCDTPDASHCLPSLAAPPVPLTALHKAELLLQTLLTRPQQIVHRAVSISPV